MQQYDEIILFARYSDPVAQAKGTSIERQIEGGTDWLTKRGLSPSRPSIIDKGKSGYHGHHRSHGNFGAFETEVLGGLHTNTLFVCELADRMGREGHHAFMALMNSFLANGVTVAFWRTDRVYDAGQELDLVQSITLMVEADLARKESENKAGRSASNWDIRTRKAADTGKAMSSVICPPWLMVDDDGRYALNSDKLPYLARIFELAEVEGSSRVMREMNKLGKPAGWSNRKRKDLSTRWQRSEIIRILADRAVIGEKVQPDGKIISGFYPVAIDPALFARVRAAADGKKERKGGGKSGDQVTNLLTRKVFCADCGGRAHINANYYYCMDAKEGGKCQNKRGTMYKGKTGNGLEKTLLDAVLHLAMDDSAFADSGELVRVNRLIAERKREHELAVIEAKDAARYAAKKQTAMAEEIADEAEARAKEIKANLDGLERQRNEARGRTDSAAHLLRVADLRARMHETNVRLMVAQALGNIIDAVRIKDGNATVSLVAGLGAFEIVGNEVRALDLGTNEAIMRGVIPLPRRGGEPENAARADVVRRIAKQNK